MTVFYGANSTKVLSTFVTPGVGTTDASVRAFNETIAAGTYTTSDTIIVARMPKGAVFMFGVLNTDTSTSTATIAIGITGTTGKYRAAAAKTTTNAPEIFGVVAATNVANTAEESVFWTIAVASLPTTALFTNSMVYAFN